METTTTPITLPRLERSTDDRVIAGVASGIAQHAGISVGLVRLGFIVAAFFGGFGIALYLAAWALMPEPGEAESAAERWYAGLREPDRRTGAILIGIAVGFIAVSLAPLTVTVIVALFVAGVLLNRDRPADDDDGTADGNITGA